MTAIDERVIAQLADQASRMMAAGWRGNPNMSGDDRDFMTAGMRRRHDERVRSVVDFVLSQVEALRAGSTGETEGWVLVPKDALRWLNGEHEDGFERPADARGNFWWRTEFKRRAMLSAAGGTE